MMLERSKWRGVIHVDDERLRFILKRSWLSQSCFARRLVRGLQVDDLRDWLLQLTKACFSWMVGVPVQAGSWEIDRHWQQKPILLLKKDAVKNQTRNHFPQQGNFLAGTLVDFV